MVSKSDAKKGGKGGSTKEPHCDPEIGAIVAILTYFSYFLLTVIGHVRDFAGGVFGYSRYRGNLRKKGYSPLFKSWESFFTRRLYHRLQDCWNRPLCSGPGVRVKVMERVSKDNFCTLNVTDNHTDALNIGSYNYLGFADDWRKTSGESVIQAVDWWPNSMCSSRMNLGSTALHCELEQLIAEFVGKEDAIVYAMGYGTNMSTIPALMGPGSLIISDALNHTSIVNGARHASSHILVFRHNEPAHLEEILREAIVKGQPKHHRPWRKILVMVEGIYSMEGAICKLPEIVRVCKKYKAYIYVDEAHSIGALGRTGRGICEYHNIDPSEIDILMGTFTKSFNGMGGFIAGNKSTIAHLRGHAAGLLHHNSMSPIVCQQILTSLNIIMGRDGTSLGQDKIEALRVNSNFFRTEMQRIGLHVYGDSDSPIVPVLIYQPAKVAGFSRECLKRGVAVVVVGFPATSVVLSRARFCISAGHTRADLEYAVKVIDEVADLCCMKYQFHTLG